VLPVSHMHQAYADRVADRLVASGFRTDVVAADESLGARIRKGKLEKLPYILVVGNDDVEAGTVGVNSRESERPVRDVPLDTFIEQLQAEVLAHLEPPTTR
jgi:threonyl-tRNA synthetase